MMVCCESIGVGGTSRRRFREGIRFLGLGLSGAEFNLGYFQMADVGVLWGRKYYAI